jgi:excisionase family DNA binding protein
VSDPLVAALLDKLLPELQQLFDEMWAEKSARFTPPPPDVWMTVAEAARHLKLSPEAVRARLRRGTLPGYRDEGRWLVHRDELDAHLHRSQNDSGARATIQGVIDN